MFISIWFRGYRYKLLLNIFNIYNYYSVLNKKTKGGHRNFIGWWKKQQLFFETDFWFGNTYNIYIKIEKGGGGERKRTLPAKEFEITDVNLMTWKRYTTQERLTKLHRLMCKLILMENLFTVHKWWLGFIFWAQMQIATVLIPKYNFHSKIVFHLINLLFSNKLSSPHL